MYTSPSIDDLLAGVVVALGEEIMPFLSTGKSQATAAMMQSVLMGVRQMLPVYDALLVDEHNGMTKALRDAAAALGDAAGPHADSIRGLAATLGSQPDLPEPPARADLMAAHREVGEGLVQAVLALDELQRAGDARADAALDVLRAHFATRVQRDVDVITMGGGFVGRG